jgi:hypothetical protein
MAEEREIEVAFTPEEFVEPRREFRGRIVRAEWGCADKESKYYNEWVFPTQAPADIRERQAERQAYALRIEIMPIDRPWNNIYEWYSLSQVRLSKWDYFIRALTATKAEIDTKGNTVEERLNNFCKSLVGMEFKWVESTDLPTLGGRTIRRLLLPTEYYGKTEVGEYEKTVI